MCVENAKFPSDELCRDPHDSFKQAAQHSEKMKSEIRPMCDGPVAEPSVSDTVVDSTEQDLITRQLPPEIMSAIFECYVARELPLAYDLANPLILGAVSSRWRSIAWRTPQIWKEIRLVFSILTLTPTRAQTVFDLAWQWLGRAGDLPLLIDFKFDSERRPPAEIVEACNMLYPIVDLVKGYYRRWYYLDLNVCPALLSRFFRGLQGVSRIQSLDLSIISPDETVFEERLPMSNFEIAPSHLSSHGIELQSITMVWSKLTSTTFGKLRVDECLEVLRRASRLEFFHINQVGPPGEEYPLPTNPLVGNNLEIFQMFVYPDCDHPNPLDLILAKTTFPSLGSLSCDLWGWEHSLSSVILGSFLDRSSCHLTRLTMKSGLESDNLFSALPKAPYLQYLGVETRQRSFDEAHIFLQLLSETSQILGQDSEHQAFLPCLKSLDLAIEVPDVREFRWDFVPPIFGPLDEVGSSKQRPLRELSIIITEDLLRETATGLRLEPNLLPQLLGLQNAGIKVELFEGGHNLYPPPDDDDEKVDVEAT